MGAAGAPHQAQGRILRKDDAVQQKVRWDRMLEPPGVESPDAFHFLLNCCAIRDLARLAAAANRTVAQLV